MLLESDILRLFFTGPYLVSSPLCSVSGADCPSVDPRQLLLLASLLSSHQLFLLLSNYQLSLLGRVVNSHSRVPLPLPDTARFHVQESFVWFRAKTDSSALAACPHSATLVQYSSQHSCIIAIFFSIHLARIHVVDPCSSIDTTITWKKTAFDFISQV